MEDIDKLKFVIANTKCGFYLSVNENRDYYEDMKEYVDNIEDRYQDEIDKEVKEEILKANQIYELQFYPQTPIGFHKVYGASLSYVLNEAYEILKTREGK